MQTVRISWETLMEGLSDVSLDELTEIRFKFDREQDGLLAVDEIQLTK